MSQENGAGDDGGSSPAPAPAAAAPAAPAGSIDLTVLAADALARHNSADDCWVSIHDKVLNVTQLVLQS